MGQGKSVWFERGLLALILALSLVLRLTALDVFETSDEDQWKKCSLRFGIALHKQDWADTYQMGHPGAVTMWLGAAAAEHLGQLELPQAEELLREIMRADVPDPGAGLPALTLGARRLVALVSWLGIITLALLLHKLFDRQTALFATVLVALDPFFLAHSRIHHLDAVLTTLSALAVAGLLVYRFRSRRLVYLLASALAAGLAVANKSPAVLLGPWAALVMLAPILSEPPAERKRALVRSVRALALWGTVVVVTLVAAWPALWVNPLETLRKTVGLARLYAATPHEHGNFFWFAVHPDPGPAFYPVAWAFRTTPWVLLGLVGLAAARGERKLRAPLGAVLAWVLLFGLVMTLGDKKFDRYFLPAVPWLDVLAAVGWVALLRRWYKVASSHWHTWAPASLAAALAVGQFALLWPTQPYYLSYYNPLLGGGKGASRVLLVGWGEGLERAAAYLNDKAGAEELVVGVWHEHEFGDYFAGETRHVEDVALAEPDYYVFYSNMLQRQLNPEVTAPFVGRREPEYVVSRNGIDYAWIYENTLYRHAEQEILARIEAQADPTEDLLLLDVDAAFARAYEGPLPLQVFRPRARHDVVQMELQRLATGRRHIWHLVYPDATEGISALTAEHLGRGAAVGEEIIVDGVRAVRYDLPPEPHFVPENPSTLSNVRFGEEITLVGYDAEAELVPGEPLQVRFHWQAQSWVPGNITVFIHVIGPGEAKYGQSDSWPQGAKFPTSAWPPGERILDDYEVDLAPDAPPGGYVLVVGMYDENGRRLPAYDPAGNELANDVLVLTGFTVGEQSGQ